MKVLTFALLASLSFSAAAQDKTADKNVDKPKVSTAQKETAKRLGRTKSGRLILPVMTADQFTRRK